MTCMMSSSGSLQMGQLECFLCFLLTMITPVAAVLLSHLVMNVCLDKVAAFLAFPYAFQLILESRRSGSMCNFSSFLSGARSMPIQLLSKPDLMVYPVPLTVLGQDSLRSHLSSLLLSTTPLLIETWVLYHAGRTILY